MNLQKQFVSSQCALMLVAFCVMPLSVIRAQTFTWTHLAGGNASGSWATQANWTGGTLPTTTAATALFNTLDLTANSTITLDGNTAVGALTFGDANTATPANWILNPGFPSSSTLTIGGASPAITVNNLASGAAIINAVIGGTNGFAVSSAGSYLQLNATNTYSGGTMLSGPAGNGSLSVGNNSALGTGLVTMGATPGDGQVWFQSAGNRRLTNNFEIRTVRWIIDGSPVNGSAAGDLTINGNVLLNNGAVNVRDIYCNMNLTVNGNLSVAPAGNPLNKQGGYTLTLNGSNYVGGASAVNGGTLVINGPISGGAAYTVNSGTMLVVNGAMTGGPVITVNSGATLAGGGSLGFVAVQNGGKVLVGTNGTGTMTVAGYNSRANGSLTLALGATNNASNGFLQVNGNLVLAGNLAINDLGGFSAGNYTNIGYSGTLSYSGLASISAPGGRTVLVNTSTPHYAIFQVLNGILSPTAGQAVPMDLTAPLPLSWVQSLTAVAYNVYLGASSNAVAAATTNSAGIYLGQTAGLTWNATNLQPNTTYYWRVDGVAANGVVTPGAVVSFTTGAAMVDLWEDTWVATDALQRSLPGHADCGSPRTNRPIGLFYFLWHQYAPGFGSGTNWDVSRWISAHPFTDPHNPWADNPIFETAKSTYWWGQPELGYYDPSDPWMLRRQIALLSHAGIDVLIFDYSNAVTYDTQLNALCDMIRQMRLEGYPVPLKIVFLTHAGSAATATYLYNTLYSQNKYSDLWFYWQGKPLILGYVNGLDATDPAPSATVQNFFTWRQSWAWEGGLDKMAWIDSTTPQQFGYHDAPDHPESTPVTCGGWSAGNIGHSYTNRTQPAYDNYHLPVARTEGQGLFYAEQNAYGLKYDPQFLFITSWNEWIAGSFAANPAGSVSMLGNPCPLNGYYFVDEYNEEYSRDIEPMKGGHTDNYYFQMVGQNRLRKGVRPVPVAGAPQTINLTGGFSQWTNVSPTYYDPVKDTIWRNFAGASAAQMGTYTNTTGRNDLTGLKVARDADNFYFLAQCNSNLTSYTGSNWMVLLIDADTNHLTGWEGYDFAVNLGGRTAATTTLSQNPSTNNGWSWSPVSSSIAYTVSGNQLMLAIPRPALGLTNDSVTFDFHWADNFQTNDIADFGVNGDSAPDRRFNYRYQTAVSPPVTLFQDHFESGKQSAWGTTWTNGSKWSLTAATSYSSNNCAYANTGNGTANSAMINQIDSSSLDSLRVSFYYKLHNVANAQNLSVQYLTGTGGVTVKIISRDQYYPTGQIWGYDEKQDVWLKFVDSRARTGTNQMFFNKNFAVRIDASGVTTGSQSVWVDDFLVTGTLGVGPTNLIVNGDFAANAPAFTTWPGYAGGANPASITGWSNINGGSVGVNGAWVNFASPNPFGPTNSGGRTYAFIQHGVNGLAQNLPLTSNATYQLDYEVAARAGNTASYQVQIGDVTQTYFSVSNVPGNNAAFSHATATFTTPATPNGTPSIQLYNLTVAFDNTIDFGNVSLVLLGTNSPTTTTLASSLNPSLPGTNVIFTATVSAPGGGTPTNAVQFLTNGVAAALVSLNGSAQATYAASSLPHGSNVVTAEYVSDGNFLTSTGSVVQVVNTRPVANALTLGAVSGLPATLHIIGGANVPTDADGDPLTVAAVSAPAHGLAVTDSTNATYTATNNFAGTDSFIYTVSDLYGGTATNTVTVNVIANTPDLNRMAVGLSGGNVVLKFMGIPWNRYALEQSISLTPPVWMPVVTNPAAADDYLWFTNPPPPGTNSFWRIRQVP